MNVIFLQTYPIYHEGLSEEQWLSLENRDKWMPALTVSLGYPCELWAVGKKSSVHTYRWNDDISVTIRLFPADSLSGRTKKHTSRELVRYAGDQEIGHLFLKGTDGGAGLQILKDLLIPRTIPWSFVVGGEYHSRFNSAASSVLCETRNQLTFLRNPTWFRKQFSRSTINPNAFILPKSVDTEHFCPNQTVSKEWDVITAGRLMDYYKDYSALKELSGSLRVAVLGGGAAEEALRKQMPDIEWLGQVPNHQIPEYLVKARSFFHTSLNDHFPRVIPEAAACGVPVIAFGQSIASDVLPADIGLRISGKKRASDEILKLLDDDAKLLEMGKKARNFAEQRWHKHSSLPLLKKVLGAY